MVVKIKALYFLLFGLVVFMIIGCNESQNIQISYKAPQCIEKQSECSIKTSSGDFSIFFNVNKVITENPFDIIVDLDSESKILEISGYMEGRDMFMGKVPLFFDKTSQVNRYVSHSLLGSCSEEKMIWVIKMNVTIESNDKKTVTEKLSIEFESSRV